MRSKEFIEMMRQDIETAKEKEQYQSVIALLESVLGDKEVEIDAKKTVSDAFGLIKDRARKKAVNGCYCMSDQEAKEIICEYFGIKETKSDAEGIKEVNFDDFF